VLNKFRTVIYPSSGACDYSVELPYWSYCSWFDVCWRSGVVGLEWYQRCRLKHLCFNTDTTSTQPHRNSNTHRTENNTINVVIQQNSRKLLMMDILRSEICWANKNWNKIASDIKLVFYSLTITMMHGPLNIRCTNSCFIIRFIIPSTCFEHYVLIIRRSKFFYTASGIITPVDGRPVHRLKEDTLMWWYQMLYNTNLTSWWCAHSARNM